MTDAVCGTGLSSRQICFSEVKPAAGVSGEKRTAAFMLGRRTFHCFAGDSGDRRGRVSSRADVGRMASRWAKAARWRNTMRVAYTCANGCSTPTPTTCHLSAVIKAISGITSQATFGTVYGPSRVVVAGILRLQRADHL
jgi:hypothetical protein